MKLTNLIKLIELLTLIKLPFKAFLGDSAKWSAIQILTPPPPEKGEFKTIALIQDHYICRFRTICEIQDHSMGLWDMRDGVMGERRMWHVLILVAMVLTLEAMVLNPKFPMVCVSGMVLNLGA